MKKITVLRDHSTTRAPGPSPHAPNDSDCIYPFVGCNDDQIDQERMDAWIGRIAEWKEANNIRVLAFFLHQHKEKTSAALAAYFTKKLNSRIGTNINVPTLKTPRQIGKNDEPAR